jgi:hypothetical protein
LWDGERLVGMALLDVMREAILEIGLMAALWGMNRKGVRERLHPVPRHISTAHHGSSERA